MHPHQAEHAVRNIVRLIEGQDSELEVYTAPPAGIKVSLGLVSFLRACTSSTLMLIRFGIPETRSPSDK